MADMIRNPLLRPAASKQLLDGADRVVCQFPRVIAYSDVSKVLGPVVMPHTVDVIGHVAVWARAVKRMSDNAVNAQSRVLAVVNNIHTHVAVSVKALFQQFLPSTTAKRPQLSKARNLIPTFCAGNRAPFFLHRSLLNGAMQKYSDWGEVSISVPVPFRVEL